MDLSEFVNLDKLKKDLSKIYIEAMISGCDQYQADRDFAEEDVGDPDECPLSLWEIREQSFEKNCRIHEIFRIHTIEPLIINPEELTDVFLSLIDLNFQVDFSCFSESSKEITPKKIGIDIIRQFEHRDQFLRDKYYLHFEQEWIGFVDQIKQRISNKKSDILTITPFIHHQSSSETPPLDDYEIPVIESKIFCKVIFQEVNVLECTSRSKSQEKRQFYNFCIQVYGVITTYSLGKILDELKEVLTHIIKSLTILSMSEAEVDNLKLEALPINYPDKYLGTISSSLVTSSRDFIKQYVAIKYLKRQGKKLLSKRISNAIDLLVRSYVVDDYAVIMCLSFSAMEALLCNNQSSITEQLSRNISTLLENNPNNRNQHIENIKKLYDKRSRFLHGDTSNVEKKYAVLTYYLAFCVLKYTIEWKYFDKRLSLDDKSLESEFFKQINDSFTSGKRLTGLDRSNNWLKFIDKNL